MSFKVGDIVVLDPPKIPGMSVCPNDPGGPHNPGHGCHYYNRGSKATVTEVSAGHALIGVRFFDEPVRSWGVGNKGEQSYRCNEKGFKLYIEPEPEPPSIYNGMEDLIF